MLLATAATIVGAAWLLSVYPLRQADPQGKAVTVHVTPHSDLWALGRELEAKHVIRNATAWTLYMRLLGANEHLRDGTVILHEGMKPFAAVFRLATGFGDSAARVTVPEGFNRYDLAARLQAKEVCDAAEFLAATEDQALLRSLGIPGATAEGYLFPDTYEFLRPTSPKDVVTRLAQNFRRRVGDVLGASVDPRWGPLQFGPAEIVTLASVVEEEAQAADEQPIIAGVFLNRLTDATFRPKRLQADPTVSYGCRVDPAVSAPCQAFDGRTITRAMTSDPANPYNTYRHDGLPPGPIANPGLGALRAVAAPATHDYFYFVARGDGRHRFSHSLDEHNAAVEAAHSP